MKIAVLTQTYPPMVSGAAVFAQRLSESLAERGHSLLVIAASETPDPYRVQKKNLTIIRLRSFRNPTRSGQRFMLWPYRRIRLSLRKFEPDIIHVHEPFGLAIAALSYARKSGAVSVLTVHAVPQMITATLGAPREAKKVMETLAWQYSQSLVNQFDALVAPSKTAANLIFEHTHRMPEAISGGVDLEVYHPGPLPDYQKANLRQQLGLPDGAPVILHAGRLDTEKQVEVVIRAAAKSMESSPAHLLMIGDGTCREDLEYLCRDLGIAERAHFTGFIHDSRLLSWYYRLANVFVITSQIETQGLAALEAAACGLPIIAANAGALPELVRHEVNGFLAPPGEVEATSQWLTKLLRDPALARQMGTNSWNIAQEHAFEHTVEAYEACFRKAINQAKEQQSVTRSTVFDL